ncbi:MAG: T9SS type A sorting domain-containing protein [Sphingobacteriales bacterium JAD_PAG50586_3]|nr:MAG: T9SS type A sorting domain-containing protein [Sphingobacteriales bacterium JAD_PAG50586_3]
MKRLILFAAAVLAATFTYAQTCPNPFYINYSSANGDDNLSAAVVSTNPSPEGYFSEVAVAFKPGVIAGYDVPANFNNPTVMYFQYEIDSIITQIVHRNASGTMDTIVFYAALNDSLTGPIANTIFWSDTIFTNTSITPTPLPAAPTRLAIPAFIPVSNNDIAIGMQYFGSISDTFGVTGTSVFNGTLGTDLRSTYPNSYFKVTSIDNNWRRNVDIDEGNGQPLENQNWQLYTHICYDATTGVKEASINNITIYPNPAQNTLNINLGKAPVNATIQLLNPLGQTVKTISQNNAQQLTVDIADMPAGIYFVRVNTPNAVKTLRIVKE